MLWIRVLRLGCDRLILIFCCLVHAHSRRSKLVPNFVRLSVANVGPGTRNGYSSLLSELRCVLGVPLFNWLILSAVSHSFFQLPYHTQLSPDIY